MECRIGTRHATLAMFERYKKINNDFNTLCKPPKNEIEGLIDKGIEEVFTLPIDKLSRWLGYIQHYIISNGLTSVEAERNFSRPLFHQGYIEDGIDVPESVTVSTV